MEGTLPKVKCVSDESVDEIDITVDIGGLAALLMGAVSAKDLVFEGKLEGESHWIDYLDMVYPKQNTYIKRMVVI